MRPSPTRRVATAAVAVLSAGALSVGFLAAPAEAAADPATRLAERLVRQTNGGDANRHLIALQRISDRNGGNRAAPDGESAAAPGYEASVEYVSGQLRRAGYLVDVQDFTYPVEVELAASITVGGTAYRIDKMNESIDTPAGGITGPIRVVPEDATTGCEATDFAGQVFTGSVALIRRGGCTFEQKSLNAAAAGAVAAVISNNTAGPLSNVTITNTGPIPVGGISQADGTTLAAQAGAAATVEMRYEEQTRTSQNVIAETRTGKRNNVVMAGAHLDAVYAGINDNGSGSAALLDVALKLGGSPNVGNRVRFAWWGAEELGLIGSSEYVKSLTFEQQLDIALYLNFDMVASPNAAYFVYDGDNSDAVGAGSGPYGSAQIEKTFTDFFSDRLGIETEGTDFSGRSDYGEFIANGIPAGGLFSGAEGIMTAAQAAKWDGTAGIAYDPCYHQECDNLGNINREALDRNLDAMAWSVGLYAYSTQEINGVPPRAQRLTMRSAAKNKMKLAGTYVPSDKAA
ncbi:M28 family metallopeptidase [Microlunatus aurantiacus]